MSQQHKACQSQPKVLQLTSCLTGRTELRFPRGNVQNMVPLQDEDLHLWDADQTLNHICHDDRQADQYSCHEKRTWKYIKTDGCQSHQNFRVLSSSES